jgi:hypothetical protein
MKVNSCHPAPSRRARRRGCWWRNGTVSSRRGVLHSSCDCEVSVGHCKVFRWVGAWRSLQAKSY